MKESLSAPYHDNAIGAEDEISAHLYLGNDVVAVGDERLLFQRASVGRVVVPTNTD